MGPHFSVAPPYRAGGDEDAKCRGAEGRGVKGIQNPLFRIKRSTYSTLLRPYCTAKRTREILISNIRLLSPQKWSQFIHFDVEKVFLRGQP